MLSNKKKSSLSKIRKQKNRNKKRKERKVRARLNKLELESFKCVICKDTEIKCFGDQHELRKWITCVDSKSIYYCTEHCYHVGCLIHWAALFWKSNEAVPCCISKNPIVQINTEFGKKNLDMYKNFLLSLTHNATTEEEEEDNEDSLFAAVASIFDDFHVDIPISEPDDTEYEIEEIVGENLTQYEIKWVGYQDTTFEPKASISSQSKQSVIDYRKKIKKISKSYVN